MINTAPDPEVQCQDCKVSMDWAFFSDDTYEINCELCGYYERYQFSDDEFISRGYENVKEDAEPTFEADDYYGGY